MLLTSPRILSCYGRLVEGEGLSGALRGTPPIVWDVTPETARDSLVVWYKSFHEVFIFQHLDSVRRDFDAV